MPAGRAGGKGRGGKIRREICIICWVFSGFLATARTMTQCVSINQLAVIQPGKESNERRREVERGRRTASWSSELKRLPKTAAKFQMPFLVIRNQRVEVLVVVDVVVACQDVIFSFS